MDALDSHKKIVEDFAAKSFELIKQAQHSPEQLLSIIGDFKTLTEMYFKVAETLLSKPENMMALQTEYWRDALALGELQMKAWMEGRFFDLPALVEDRRFSHESWNMHPFFHLLSQHYLIASKHIQDLIDKSTYKDAKEARKVRFYTSQWLDTLSPANFLMSNPELLQETITSKGQNLVKGLDNFLQDIKAGKTNPLITMTDKTAFKIGENLAATPGKVIYRNEMMELIQYSPQTETCYSIPLLIIPPWINKYYILDLSQHNSFVGWLVKQGLTVFIISWVNPDASLAQKSMSDYLAEGPLTALDVIKAQCKVDKVNTLGFCIGGTLEACMLAYLQAKKDDTVASATFLAAMIDFSDPGDISVFIDEAQIQKLEDIMQKKGYLEGERMAQTFNALRANDLIWSFFIHNYLKGKAPRPFDILYWNGDATNMPATMHAEYLRGMYLNNALVQPKAISLLGTPLDVTKLKTPAFFVSTEKDHIAPWQTVYKGFELFQGPKHFLLGGSGHIAGIINPPDTGKYGFYRNAATHEDADTWLANAQFVHQSWWSEWKGWLAEYSGKQVLAKPISSLKYKGLEDAPGTYVLKTATHSGVVAAHEHKVEETFSAPKPKTVKPGRSKAQARSTQKAKKTVKAKTEAKKTSSTK